jgi:hypothetical protein
MGQEDLVPTVAGYRLLRSFDLINCEGGAAPVALRLKSRYPLADLGVPRPFHRLLHRACRLLGRKAQVAGPSRESTRYWLLCGTTVKVALRLAWFPTVTTTGWSPGGTCGTWKFTCVTPTSPGGIPAKRTGALTPPIVTLTC